MELNNNIYYSDLDFTPIPENKEIEPNVGGDYSSAVGMGTKTISDSEVAAGKFNATQEEPKVILSVGIGKSKEERENAITILENGEVYVKGLGGYDGTNLPASSIQDIIGEEVAETVPLEPGDAENSLVQEGSNAVAFGVNSTAFGTSSTDAKDRGITEESTLEDIITEWAASDPEDQKFALTLGEGSHIEGNNCLALGKNSHAEGNGTVAGNNSSHAEGTGAKAIGKYAHAEGLETIAEGNGSHTEGKETHTSGNTSDYSHAEGDNTAVEVRAGHAEGYKSIAARSGYSENTLTPHAQGTGTSGWVNGISHAEGNATIAQGLGAHAEGEKTFANGRTAHAEGLETVASGNYASHAEGEATIASGEDSHAEGFKTKAAALASHAEGNRTVINEGGRSHTEGYGTYAKGVGAHSEGINGYYIVLQRNGSSENVYNIKQIEGMTPADALAAGKYPKVGDLNAEDSKTVKSVDTTNHTITMSGNWGGNNKWSRLYFIINDIEDTSLRENDGALGFAAHAEGVHTKANGFGSHTEGEMTVANGDTSHAEGWRTKTENQCEHAQGQYNVSHKASGTFGDAGNTIHSVGIGNRTDNYGNGDNKNAFEIMQNGDIYVFGLGDYIGTTIENCLTLQDILRPIRIEADEQNMITSEQLAAAANAFDSGRTVLLITLSGDKEIMLGINGSTIYGKTLEFIC